MRRPHLSTGAWIFATAALVLAVAAPVSYAAVSSTVAIGNSANGFTAAVNQARQLQVTTASPAETVTVVNPLTCNANGIYVVPAGKALIITGVNFYNFNASTGRDEQDLKIGPASSPCSEIVAGGVDSDPTQTIPETFNPGIAVPAGDAVGGSSINDVGSTGIDGYLVPAGAVPGAVPGAPTNRHAGLARSHG